MNIKLYLFCRTKSIVTNPYGKLPFLAEKRRPHTEGRDNYKEHTLTFDCFGPGFFQPN